MPSVKPAIRYPWGDSEEETQLQAQALARRSGISLQVALERIAESFGFSNHEHARRNALCVPGLHWRWSGPTFQYIQSAQQILNWHRDIADFNHLGQRPYACLSHNSADATPRLQLLNLDAQTVINHEFAMPLPAPLDWSALTALLQTDPLASSYADFLTAYRNRREQSAAWRLSQRVFAGRLQEALTSPSLKPVPGSYHPCPHFPVGMTASGQTAATFRNWILGQGDALAAEFSLWGTASIVAIPVWKPLQEEARLYLIHAIQQSAARLGQTLRFMPMDALVHTLQERLRQRARRELPTRLWRHVAKAAPEKAPPWLLIYRLPSFSSADLRLDQHVSRYCHTLADIADARAEAEAQNATHIRLLGAAEADRLEAATTPAGPLTISRRREAI